VDSASGNLARAIRHYQQYKALEDSLFSEENTRSVNELNIEYETAKKDGELKLKEANIAVLSKQQKLQEAEIASSRVSKNIVIGGSIALAILLALIFNQYRIKKRQFVLERKSNAALITKQQEINGKNSLLQELVDSRELLIKEIHHRVKNSLQVIMSLLNTQSDYSNSEQAFLTIQESRQRLYAISLIHQKLYYTASLTLVKMDTYIPELIDFLRDGYVEKERIRFELSLQAIELDVTQALPIGLILNEGVTNSIKHAFPDKRAGTIKISFTAGPERQLTFIMEDNGIGIPADAELLKNDSMGVQLMHTLSLQLGGEITFASENGLKVIVTFKQRRPAPLVNEIS
jgi:two-component sensor histidine kinase